MYYLVSHLYSKLSMGFLYSIVIYISDVLIRLMLYLLDIYRIVSFFFVHILTHRTSNADSC